MAITLSIIFYPILLAFVIIISKKFNFVDTPNFRKIHQKPIPNTSGFALYLMLIYLISFEKLSYDVEYIIATGSIIVLVGFFDDRKNLTPGVKLCLILLPILILVFEGYFLKNLGSYEFIGEVRLGKFSYIFTLLAIGLLINSFNYIDGIDGLLNGISLTSMVFFIFLNNLNDDYLNILSFLIYGLIINIIFNFLPIKNNFKCFTGDAGSLFLGFFISFMMIFLFTKKNIHPSYLIWAVWYPVYDFLSVNIIRLIKNKNIFQPDKIHFHHFILKYFNNSHIKSFFFINIINILVLISGYIVAIKIGKVYSVFLFIFLFFVFFKIRYFLIKKLAS